MTERRWSAAGISIFDGDICQGTIQFKIAPKLFRLLEHIGYAARGDCEPVVPHRQEAM